MAEIISASHDVVFKALFVRNPDILRAFLRIYLICRLQTAIR